MYSESINNFSSAEELMNYNSIQTSTDNSDYNINNNLVDFNIYSQPSTLTNDYPEHELYTPLHVGQQASFVNQQQEQSTTEIPLNNHTVEDFHYTTPDQSDFVSTSPHGYSENITTPLLEPYNGAFSVHSTPLLQDNNQLLFSPIISTSPIIDDTQTVSDFGTPFIPTVPLITPNTPYTPYVTNNSPFSVASSIINTPFAFQATSLLNTPLEQSDTNLYEEPAGGKWFNLFDPVKTIVSTDRNIYEDNNIIYTYMMDSISPTIVEKSEIIVNESPKSDDIPDKNLETPSNLVDNSITIPANDSIDSSKVIETGIIETIKAEVIVNDSTTTTSDPKLIPIRPRPQDEDDSGENDSTRRSKRQRTLSMSEENDDDNDDETEKKYNCPECGRGFNRKFNMQTHRLTHDPNRIKPFACEHPNCGSRFTRKHDLKRHINGIHKGEKVHECTVCRKPFSRKDAWKRHITTCGKM